MTAAFQNRSLHKNLLVIIAEYCTTYREFSVRYSEYCDVFYVSFGGIDANIGLAASRAARRDRRAETGGEGRCPSPPGRRAGGRQLGRREAEGAEDGALTPEHSRGADARGRSGALALNISSARFRFVMREIVMREPPLPSAGS